MRVITGTAKGIHLVTADGLDVRPTPEKVKEGIFSSIQFDIEGRKILDLFGGSGQLGIEALSRGAEYALFVDCNPDSIKIITENLEKTKLADKAKVIRGDFSAVMLGLNEKFDFAFLDPPYQAGFLLKALNMVIPHINEYGKVFCEHPNDIELPERVGEMTKSKVFRYGKILVSVFERRHEDIE